MPPPEADLPESGFTRGPGDLASVTTALLSLPLDLALAGNGFPNLYNHLRAPVRVKADPPRRSDGVDRDEPRHPPPPRQSRTACDQDDEREGGPGRDGPKKREQNGHLRVVATAHARYAEFVGGPGCGVGQGGDDEERRQPSDAEGLLRRELGRLAEIAGAQEWRGPCNDLVFSGALSTSACAGGETGARLGRRSPPTSGKSNRPSPDAADWRGPPAREGTQRAVATPGYPAETAAPPVGPRSAGGASAGGPLLPGLSDGRLQRRPSAAGRAGEVTTLPPCADVNRNSAPRLRPYMPR